MMNILCFDCESIGLWGEAFAVGAVVLEKQTGAEIDHFELVCEELLPFAIEHDWVREHVIPQLENIPRCKTILEFRDRFYHFLQKHKTTAEIWADVGFPVETNFLSALAKDDLQNRFWEMPYPLRDISSVLDINIDRIQASGIQGLRKHHPTDDARASAVCYLKYFNRL